MAEQREDYNFNAAIKAHDTKSHTPAGKQRDRTEEDKAHEGSS